jgi:hypothetical protein
MAKEGKVYRTDKLTFLSYGLLVVAYALFIAVIVKKVGGFNSLIFLIALFVLPVFGYFLFLLKKSVKITNEEIEVFGLTGRKKIRWNEIISVSLTPGRKYFLFIESKDGKLAVIDDSTENFIEIAKEVREKAPVRLSEDYDKFLSFYRRSYTSIGILIFAAIVLIFVALRNLI